jgi:hypothetical protein
VRGRRATYFAYFVADSKEIEAFGLLFGLLRQKVVAVLVTSTEIK